MSAMLSGLISGTVIDGEALLDTALTSIAGAVVVTLACSVAIYGFAMAAEMRRDERALAATAAGALGVFSTLVFAAVIVVGIVVMVNG